MNSNWKVSKLAELCEIRHGFAFKSKDFAKNADEALPIVLTPGNFRSEGKLLFNESNTKRCLNSYPKGFLFSVYELVVVMTDLSSQMKILGKPAIIDKPNILHNQRIGRFVFSEKINIHFVRYFLLTDDYLRNIKDTATGTMVKHTAPKRILDCKIPIPPLPEQKRIVKILDKAFAAIDKAKANAEKNLANAKELFESYLNGIFANEEWEENTLSEVIVEMMTGPFGSMLHKSDYVENGIPVINPQNIVNGKIISLQKTMISKDTFEKLGKYSLQENDIIMARRGEMGRCAIVRKENIGWLCGTGNLVIRANKKKIDEPFLNLYLRSSKIKKQLENSSIGATMSNLNQKILSELQLTLPSVQEQKTVIENIDALSVETKKLQGIYQQKIEELEELKKSILQKAFEGEL